jgi:ubiquinone/menaquinone biosynthesis C-methylase UbiE
MHDVHTSTDNYAERFSGAIGDFFNEVETHAFLNLLGRWPGCSVLDVGGGHARMAVPMVKAGYKVTVTGSSPSCRMRLDRYLLAGAFDFVHCPVSPLPQADRSFDAVVSTRLLAHEENWKLLISEMCRVARHAVIVDFPPFRSVNCAVGPLFKLKRKVEKNTRHFRVFRQFEIVSEVMKHGFECRSTSRQFLFPMALHRLLQSRLFTRTVEGIPRALGATALFGSPMLMLATRVEPASHPATNITQLPTALIDAPQVAAARQILPV